MKGWGKGERVGNERWKGWGRGRGGEGEGVGEGGVKGWVKKRLNHHNSPRHVTSF